MKRSNSCNISSLMWNCSIIYNIIFSYTISINVTALRTGVYTLTYDIHLVPNRPDTQESYGE